MYMGEKLSGFDERRIAGDRRILILEDDTGELASLIGDRNGG